jgi:hypothetical protein
MNAMRKLAEEQSEIDELEEILDALEDVDQLPSPVTPEIIRTTGMKKMNWKGWLVLAGIALLGVGFVAWKFGTDYVQDSLYKGYEVRIEQATHDKIDVTDIELAPLTGAGEAVWIYLHSDGQTKAPLTEKEFEAVDEVFMELVEVSDSLYTIWAWVNPAGDLWYINVFTACDSASLLVSRDNRDVPSRCETQQVFQPLDAKHLRWLNE